MQPETASGWDGQNRLKTGAVRAAISSDNVIY